MSISLSFQFTSSRGIFTHIYIYFYSHQHLHKLRLCHYYLTWVKHGALRLSSAMAEHKLNFKTQSAAYVYTTMTSLAGDQQMESKNNITLARAINVNIAYFSKIGIWSRDKAWVEFNMLHPSGLQKRVLPIPFKTNLNNLIRPHSKFRIKNLLNSLFINKDPRSNLLLLQK